MAEYSDDAKTLRNHKVMLSLTAPEDAELVRAAKEAGIAPSVLARVAMLEHIRGKTTDPIVAKLDKVLEEISKYKDTPLKERVRMFKALMNEGIPSVVASKICGVEK